MSLRFNSQDSVTPLPEYSATESEKNRHLIGKIIAPAVEFWLRSQVEGIKELAVAIEGKNRQLLTGYIPQVSLKAAGAIYQGLHLTEANLSATNIRVNIGQVIKGKPLNILETIPVKGEIFLSEADLNASLESPLVKGALNELFLEFIKNNYPDKICNLKDLYVRLTTNRMTLGGNILTEDGKISAFSVQTSLQVEAGQKLVLTNTEIQTSLPIPKDVAGLTFDLGPEVNLEEISFLPEQLVCRGQINVIPA